MNYLGVINKKIFTTVPSGDGLPMGVKLCFKMMPKIAMESPLNVFLVNHTVLLEVCLSDVNLC